MEALKIDIGDLLDLIPALRSPAARIALPDDPAAVDIADPQQFAACLDNALRAFRDVRGGADYLVNAAVNAHRREVWVRFVQRGSCQDRDGRVDPALEASFRPLRAALATSGGDLHYWGGDNYVDISLPFDGPVREHFPEVNNLPWDERYRQLLARATWDTLRGMVFRFSNLAESLAARCVHAGSSRVLVPSVGLCVHPWIFAHHGLSVVATDTATIALAVLAEPERWPRLFSRAAFERWDIGESATYASQGNPDHFARMPDLQDAGVRESLRRRVTFTLGDWANLPLASATVDAIFATNALPRESPAERHRVVEEWIRVIRPGGIVFIAQHNFFDWAIEAVVRKAGWVAADILRGERPADPGATGFQIRYSSG